MVLPQPARIKHPLSPTQLSSSPSAPRALRPILVRGHSKMMMGRTGAPGTLFPTVLRRTKQLAWRRRLRRRLKTLALDTSYTPVHQHWSSPHGLKHALSIPFNGSDDQRRGPGTLCGTPYAVPPIWTLEGRQGMHLFRCCFAASCPRNNDVSTQLGPLLPAVVVSSNAEFPITARADGHVTAELDGLPDRGAGVCVSLHRGRPQAAAVRGVSCPSPAASSNSRARTA